MKHKGVYMICLRCHTEMKFYSKEQLQLGKTGWVLGDLPNLVAGALLVNIYVCPSCHKLEFFAVNESSTDDLLPQRTCPACGTKHDFDYPKCPKCKHDYYSDPS